MTVKVRFAPSPTGYIHIGNIRPALLNWLFARKEGGTFILRFDDTDPERSKEEYVAAIEEDLTWLGLMWDEKCRQSDRLDRYAEVAADLKSRGLLYPCYEKPEELDRKRKRLLGRGLPPVYDRAALELSDEERSRLEAEGRKPHWRFKLDQKRIEWDDMIRGDSSIDCASLSDPILIREDGSMLYTFTSVVDDMDMEITHVIRGEDHVANTAVQIQIAEAIGDARIVFGHHALLTGADGQGLSKRLGSLGIRDFKADGLEPIAVIDLMARIGTSRPVEAFTTVQEVVDGFDMSILGRAAAKFDERELKNLNHKIVRQLPFSAVTDRLAQAGIDEAFWMAVRDNLNRVDDALDFKKIIEGPVTPVVEEPDYLKTALHHLPEGSWTEQTWGDWTALLKDETGRKGRQLFMPLRQAITGLDHGPEMQKLLPLLAADKVRRRLSGETI